MLLDEYAFEAKINHGTEKGLYFMCEDLVLGVIRTQFLIILHLSPYICLFSVEKGLYFADEEILSLSLVTYIFSLVLDRCLRARLIWNHVV